MRQIIALWLAALLLAAQPLQAAVCVGFGQSAAPANLVSYNIGDYSIGQASVEITGGNFVASYTDSGYPRATDLAVIPASEITYNYELEVISRASGQAYCNIGGNDGTIPITGIVGTYTGTVTSGTSGYIRVGADGVTSGNAGITFHLTLAAQ